MPSFVTGLAGRLPPWTDRLLSLAAELEVARAERDRAVAAHDRLLRDLWAPPGHFYSPIPSKEDVSARRDRLWPKPPRALPAIDLNEAGQIALLEELARFYDEMPFGPTRLEGLRYYFENDFFSYHDAIALYGMIRRCRPARIVEIGSGFSSCVILDTMDLFFPGAIDCTFIEPHPDRLLALITAADRDRIHLIQAPLQDALDDCFQRLSRNDILFIDSTHVAKIGSDVNEIFFRILPLLADGVMVHFHDVFYPFEYPLDWILEGRAWSEDYILRAFLQYNDRFRIRYFSQFLMTFHRERYEKLMPLSLRNGGASIWLEKAPAKVA